MPLPSDSSKNVNPNEIAGIRLPLRHVKKISLIQEKSGITDEELQELILPLLEYDPTIVELDEFWVFVLIRCAFLQAMKLDTFLASKVAALKNVADKKIAQLSAIFQEHHEKLDAINHTAKELNDQLISSFAAIASVTESTNSHVKELHTIKEQVPELARSGVQSEVDRLVQAKTRSTPSGSFLEQSLLPFSLGFIACALLLFCAYLAFTFTRPPSPELNQHHEQSLL